VVPSRLNVPGCLPIPPQAPNDSSTTVLGVLVAKQVGPVEQLPTVTAEVKLSVEPQRAAVFVDGVFMGHVAEVRWNRQSIAGRFAPGQRKITHQPDRVSNLRDRCQSCCQSEIKIKTELTKVGVEASPPPNQE